MRYVPPRKAREILGVSERTLRYWEQEGKIKTIRTPSNQRRYDVDSVLGEVKNKPTIIYALSLYQKTKRRPRKASGVPSKDVPERGSHQRYRYRTQLPQKRS
ncbi:MerR family DNA-binding transcriptional regulator [Moorena sp. SIO4G3]|uniref:MerR family DNA-binding transcriptional regulator n=1 Tax=Moorena sp. SIO4G3 TaxID=2607821 RepID=UPI0025E7CAFC|nr:MerR family DNA-binding transcriptional regulator [Moorena sp. SIO4G3]